MDSIVDILLRISVGCASIVVVLFSLFFVAVVGWFFPSAIGYNLVMNGKGIYGNGDNSFWNYWLTGVVVFLVIALVCYVFYMVGDLTMVFFDLKRIC